VLRIAEDGCLTRSGAATERYLASQTSRHFQDLCNTTIPAGLRTSAAHARWDEIDLGDVAPAVELARELIGAHLA